MTRTRSWVRGGVNGAAVALHCRQEEAHFRLKAHVGQSAASPRPFPPACADARQRVRSARPHMRQVASCARLNPGRAARTRVLVHVVLTPTFGWCFCPTCSPLKRRVLCRDGDTARPSRAAQRQHVSDARGRRGCRAHARDFRDGGCQPEPAAAGVRLEQGTRKK